MSATVKLYDLAPSPNNMKVRVALNYKGIPFEKIPVKSNDRAEVIRVSGQPLTPVLLHGDVVVFDSGAILRYLDANFRDTPRLFSEDYRTMVEIETWERLGRGDLSRPVGTIFAQYFTEQRDASQIERASRHLHEVSSTLEDRLAMAEWLVGNRMTAADITIAPMIYYGMLPVEVAGRSPLHRFFGDHLHLGGGRDRTRAWTLKVMAHDR